MQYNVFQIDDTSWGFELYPDAGGAANQRQLYDPTQDGFVPMDQATATTQAQIACGLIANPYKSSPRQISRLAFMQRLTGTERAALYNNNSLATDPVLFDFLFMFDKAEFINLDEPTNAQALAYFVSKGYLAANRPAQLLA